MATKRGASDDEAGGGGNGFAHLFQSDHFQIQRLHPDPCHPQRHVSNPPMQISPPRPLPSLTTRQQPPDTDLSTATPAALTTRQPNSKCEPLHPDPCHLQPDLMNPDADLSTQRRTPPQLRTTFTAAAAHRSCGTCHKSTKSMQTYAIMHSCIRARTLRHTHAFSESRQDNLPQLTGLAG